MEQLETMGDQNGKAIAQITQEPVKHQISVIFFGRLEMRKGIVTFVNAIKLLPPELQAQIHLYFIGKIVQLHALQFGQLQSDQYIEQELADKVPYEILSTLYSQEAIQFILSLEHPIVCLASHQENFPNTGLEMGQLPVSLVVSDTGGFRETLHLVNRALGVHWFKPADSHALAEQLTQVIMTHPEKPQVAKRGEIKRVNQVLLERRLALIEQAFCKSLPNVAQPKVTIGVTCYNLGKYLIECLTSIEAQTYKNLEVIIFDDASDDPETQNLIYHAKSAFPDYKYVRAEMNLGLGAARNCLIEMATGDYFLPLDADNRLLPFSVEKFVEAALHSQAAIVFSSMRYFGAFDGIHSYRFTSLPNLLHLNTCGDACSLFAMDTLKKFKHPERKDCSTHDWCIISSVIATDAKIVHYPYPLYEYRMRQHSMIKQASLPKERYYLRQYLAQIPPAEWSPRQLYMLLMTTQQLQVQLESERMRANRLETERLQLEHLEPGNRMPSAEVELLQAEVDQLRAKLQATRQRLKNVRLRLEYTESELQQSRNRAAAMETSKFWKIRKAWFRFKKTFRLPSNE